MNSPDLLSSGRILVFKRFWKGPCEQLEMIISNFGLKLMVFITCFILSGSWNSYVELAYLQKMWPSVPIATLKRTLQLCKVIFVINKMTNWRTPTKSPFNLVTPDRSGNLIWDFNPCSSVNKIEKWWTGLGDLSDADWANTKPSIFCTRAKRKKTARRLQA